MSSRQLFFGLVAASSLALGAASACSSDSTATPSAVADGGASPVDAAPAADALPPLGPNEARQRGRVLEAVDKSGLGGAVVAVAGRTVTTSADGTYELIVPKGTPYKMSVTAPDHFKHAEQEWIVHQDAFDRSDTGLLSTATASLLATFLPKRDPAKGLLVVHVIPVPPCDSEQGATLSLAPLGAAKLTYFAGGFPSAGATSTTFGEAFSGAFTDVDIGVPLTVTVQSPLCEALPFPVDFPDVTYTGVQKAEPGDVITYLRVYLGPKKIADAGAD
jgi:hypothetical protein